MQIYSKVKYSQLSRTFLFQSMVFIHSFTWFSSSVAAASASSGAASEDMVGVSLRRKDRVGLLAPRTRQTPLTAAVCPSCISYQHTKWLASVAAAGAARPHWALPLPSTLQTRAQAAEATALQQLCHQSIHTTTAYCQSLSAGFAIRCCCYNSRGPPPPTTMVAPTVTLQSFKNLQKQCKSAHKRQAYPIKYHLPTYFVQLVTYIQ